MSELPSSDRKLTRHEVAVLQYVKDGEPFREATRRGSRERTLNRLVALRLATRSWSKDKGWLYRVTTEGGNYV